ncbi:hypothetical protein BFP72_16635 [Reichenbachiella sp. 5M10]|uniref:hypothetical protein n=1 Tax=Reichenbachiella sp. 5M10 TaxID=1889772 RepID=UPI000C154C0E|nr:hypothetical protein [Reichenbachiella sp. 5M10]PIB36913.1 hypothetical protein BFP72_16635 [Reichenbachiella sp. 5M10]
MNLLKNFTRVACVGLLAFNVACDTNDDLVDEILGNEDIELTVNDMVSEDVTVYVSDLESGATSFTAKVEFTSSDASMKRLYVTENYFGAGDEPYELKGVSVDDKGDGSIDLEKDYKESFSFDIPFEVYNTSTQGEVVYTLWATSGRGDFRDTDKRLAVGIGTITVDYGGNNPASDVKEYTATILAAPLADGSSETFISLLDGEVYRVDEGEEFAAFWDFGYYYGNSNKASLASAFDFPKSIIDIPTVASTTEEELNHTYFAVSTISFDDVTKASDLSNVSASDSEAINMLSVGDEVEFIDNYGKKGVIKVVELVEGFGTEAKITIDIKVQP